MILNHKKKLIIGISASIIIIISSIGIISYFNYIQNKISLKQNNITLELGEKLNIQIKDYVKANENVYDKIYMDSSSVDSDKVGTYKIDFTYKKQKLLVEVNVVDTMAPSLTVENNGITKRVGESLSISDINYTYNDLSDVTVSFVNGTDKIILDKTERRKITLLAKDKSGNITKSDIDITVTDANDPVINNAKDLTTTVGSELDLKAGITATDVEDGDITAKLTSESDVDYNTAGSYKVSYSVEDASGNKVVNDVILIVNEKNVASASANVSSGESSSYGSSSSFGFVDAGDIFKSSKIEFSKLTTEAEKLDYINSKGFNIERLNWYIFNYSGSESEKIAKMRSTSCSGGMNNDVAWWWWNNIGSKLTMKDITRIDTSYYWTYMTTTKQSIESVRCYSNSYNYGEFYISTSDAEKCASLGYLTPGIITSHMVGSSVYHEYPIYYISNYDKLIQTCNIWID